MNTLYRQKEAWRRGVLALLLALIGVACQPKDERPGLGLRGEPAEEEVSDWSFSDGIQEIFIETRPWYGIPHSTTIWCATLGGALYVGSYGDAKKRWERNIERNPDARLSIAGRIYDVTLMPVTDGDRIRALDAAYASKYDMVEVFDEAVPEWRYYRVAQRGLPDRAAE
jgi:hypothetical protein